MSDHPQGHQVRELFFLRNYYLHGAKKHGDPNIEIDDGTQEWIEGLSNAAIHPFIIQGSEIYEAGMVDPDILDYLDDPSQTACYKKDFIRSMFMGSHDKTLAPKMLHQKILYQDSVRF